MLAARNDFLMTVTAREAHRAVRYHCPGCSEPVILKRGELVTPHFAHRPESACAIAREGESEAHRQMKWWAYDTFRGLPWVRRACVEEWLGGRRADVFLETMRGNRVAIECQASGLPREALEAKLVHYRGRGLRVLYLVHAGVLRGWQPEAGVPALHGTVQAVPGWLRALLFQYLDRFLGVRFAYLWDGTALWLVTFEPQAGHSDRTSSRHRVCVLGQVERIEQLVELRDGLQIIAGTELLLPHKAA